MSGFIFHHLLVWFGSYWLVVGLGKAALLVTSALCGRAGLVRARVGDRIVWGYVCRGLAGDLGERGANVVRQLGVVGFYFGLLSCSLLK